MERVIVCTLPVCPHLWSITLMISFSCPRPIKYSIKVILCNCQICYHWYDLNWPKFFWDIYFLNTRPIPLCVGFTDFEKQRDQVKKKIRSLKGGLFRRHAVHCSPYSNRHGYVYSHPNHISSSQSIFTSIFHCFK